MARELRLIAWPYHNGLRDVSMGAGPTRLAQDELLLASVAAAGWQISEDLVAPVDESQPEIARVTELVRRLAARVRLAVQDGAFPLVLAGNCNSCLGTVAGAGAERTGVVWFDAHADFDDPGENTSGFFDVMGLAMLTGRGWEALRATIPNHAAIAESDVVLAGVRDLEPYQRRRLESSGLIVVPGPIEPERFASALSELAARVSSVYLHIDLDSLDASEARANEYASGGGPSLERLLECVRLTGERFKLVAAALTAFDPSLDSDGRTLAAARRIAGAIAARA